jgi:hypothetical protein
MKNFDWNPPEFEVPHRELRQPLAVNLFKWMVLGDRHVPGQHQAVEVQRAMSDAGAARCADVRTWRGWFGETPRRARGTAIEALDSYTAAHLHPPRWNLDAVEPGERFFGDLFDGGLLASLMQPIAMKQPRFALLRRALDYEPLSRIHLHLDAIESAALFDSKGVAPVRLVVETAATRVLELIHSRWSPRQGTVYPELTPDLESGEREADAEEQMRIAQRDRRQRTGRPEARQPRVACPDWSLVDVESDIAPLNVYRLMLALARDADFLVADRLHVWALDLASAAIATHALPEVLPHSVHGRRNGPEMIYWEALASLFYSDETDGAVVDAIAAAFDVNKTECTEAAVDSLFRARASYRELLSKLYVHRRNLGSLVGMPSFGRLVVYCRPPLKMDDQI